MSYRNPTSKVDTSLSDAFVKKINKLGEDIRTTATNASMMAQARRNANLKLVNQIENNVEKLVGQAQDELISENLEADGFAASLQAQAVSYKKASLNLATKGDYPERAADLAKKSEFQNYTKRLPTDIAAFNTTAETFKKARVIGLSGEPGSLDLYQVNPAYLASEAIESGREDGVVTYESRVNPKTQQMETVKVARGEAIREANKKLNIEGDEYVLFSSTLKKAQTGPDSSQYQLGVGGIVPEIYNGESGLKSTFIDENIYDKNGVLVERFKGEPQTVIKVDNVGRYPVQVRNYNVEMMSEEMKPAVNARVQGLAKINNDDLNSLVRSMTYSRTIDGVTQSFYKFVKMEGGQPVRDESGKVMYEPEIQVGNGRRIGKEFNEENQDTNGYTPSDFELIQKIALQETLDKSGAYNSSVEEFKLDKQYIAEEKPTVAKVTQGERAEQMRLKKIENAVGDLSSTDYAGISERLTR
ncbi:hypothetical protein N8371_08645, partial [Vicingaceae bacterium]|nr:hypothetical protein [Vicingaceae bacterium]